MRALFTTEQYPHAIHKNDARVVKQNSERRDGTPDGTLGTVLGSMGVPDDMGGGAFYFVEWDNRPGVPVGVLERKLGAAP